MTEVEQALAGSLTSLKSAGYADLVRMLWAGLARAAHGPERSALERLSLASAATLARARHARLGARCAAAPRVGWVNPAKAGG